MIYIPCSPSCACGADIEDTYHFFYVCPLFNNERQILLHNIAHFHITHWDMLLYGNDYLEFDDNVSLFRAVHKFIESTGRLN